MSELTRCNYCTYQRMLDAARESGHTLVLKVESPDPEIAERAWTLVYRNDGPEPVAMFRELTRHCAC